MLLFFVAAFALTWWRECAHVLWRDELQAWQLVGASSSLADLFHKLHYEGHPPLWYLCLYGLRTFTADARTMQLLTAFVSAAASTLLFFSPVGTRLQRSLLCLNYYVLFEYGLLSRSYVLTLFLVAILVFMSAREGKSLWPEFIVLSFLAMTVIHGAMMALGLGVFLIWAKGLRTRWHDPALLLIFAVTLSLLCAWPAPDMHFTAHPPPQISLQRVVWMLTTYGFALLPLIRPTVTFWKNPIITQGPELGLMLGCAGAAAVIVYFMLRNSKRALICFALSALGLGLFSYFVYPGLMRHHGFVSLVLLVIVACEPELRAKLALSRAFTAWLAIGALGGLTALLMTIEFKFSRSQEAAEWIAQRTKPQERWDVVADEDFTASPISYYLDHDIYSFARLSSSRYVIWDKQRSISRSINEKVAVLHQRLKDFDTIFLVCQVGHPNNQQYKKEFRIVDEVKIDPSIAPAEGYEIFEIRGATDGDSGRGRASSDGLPSAEPSQRTGHRPPPEAH